MRKLLILTFTIFLVNVFANAQTNPTPSPTPATQTTTRRPVFRATKDQITQAQKMLKDKGLYTGETDGRMNPAFKTSVKTYQKDVGLRQSGTLNRPTLEKMGIALTDRQKEIPVNPNDLTPTNSSSSTSTTKRIIFRATKEQIMAAQKILKDGGMYAGDQTGKLDEPTREGLKKYQAANGLNVTGTLNAVTLNKMGIPLTDKQKADAANNTQ